MRAVAVVASLLGVVVAGCSAAPDAGTPAAAVPETRLLACGGGDGATPALEMSALGTCWGHIGHHHYFLGDPVDLHALSGSLFAVEVAPAQEADLDIAVQTSGDGTDWRTVLTVPYPLGDDLDDRYDIDIPETRVAAEAIRFLRVRMPFSELEGLAGYLDASRFNLTVTPAAGGPSAPAKTGGDCAASQHLEAFFDAHPCWFGGHDNLDRVSPIGDPTHLHSAYEVVDDSWWDSPSFFHTYPFLGGASGAFTAKVTAEIWRLTHFVFTCGTPAALDSLQGFDVFASASADGANWTEVARATTRTDEAVQFAGDLPAATRFVRFAAEAGGNYEAGGCHHLVAYLTDSRLALV